MSSLQRRSPRVANRAVALAVLICVSISLPAAQGGAKKAKTTSTTKPKVAGPWTAASFCRTTPTFASVGKLSSDQLIEVSGIAASQRDPNVVWVHNDSGDAARIFALDLHGKLIGTHTFSEVAAVDWEDIASAPTKTGGILAIADIGDNTRSRANVVVYRVAEPARPEISGDVGSVDTFTLTYPDGPRDAEAFTIGADGSFWIVEKALFAPAGVYRLPGGSPPGPHVLERVAELPATTAPVTAMTGVVGAQPVILRTVLGFEVFAAIAHPFSAAATCRLRGPSERQGEAVAWLADGRLITIGEGRFSDVWVVTAG